MHKKAFIAIAAIALALVGLGAHAEPTGTCAAGSVGGDWRAYGHDLSNTRTQPDEQAIGATQALGLTAAKVFNDPAPTKEGRSDGSGSGSHRGE